jgi:luciferase family oxidoreductase group 1
VDPPGSPGVTHLDRVSLDVLDLAPRPFGGTNADAVAGSVRLAQEAEAAGYSRFWVAEHHGMPGIASSAPAVLLAGIAARTSTIRVGSGGVMLPNHTPLVVAEQFGTLRALYGDRVDLGIGRAPGTDGATALALRRSEAGLGADDFPQQLVDLMGFFSGGMAEDNPLRGITAVPGLGDAPQMWLLGSSGYSAQVAAALGIRFAFAHHFAGDRTEQALEMYRERFRPSADLAAPHSAIAVSVIVDDDPEVVDRESRAGSLTFLRMRQGGRPQPVDPAEAAAYEFSDLEREIIGARNRRQAIGSPDAVRIGLERLLASTRADELIVAPSSTSLDHRIETLRTVRDLASAEVRAA